MTFVCFDIAKVECKMHNIIGYFFSLSYMPMHGLLKRKKYAKKIKAKRKKKVALYMIASVYSRRCGSYSMYLKGDSLHQTVWLCVSKSDFLKSQIVITYRHLCNLAMFFTHNMQYSLLLLIHVQVQCDLAITRNTSVNVCSLNCLNLFFKYKIG